MQRFCTVTECGGRAHHIITSSRRSGLEILVCTYHLAPVSVVAGRRYGGTVTVTFLRVLQPQSVALALESTKGLHELAS